MCDKACGEDTLYERSVSSISVSKGSESRVRALSESGKDGHCCLLIVDASITPGELTCEIETRAANDQHDEQRLTPNQSTSRSAGPQCIQKKGIELP